MWIFPSDFNPQGVFVQRGELWCEWCGGGEKVKMVDLGRDDEVKLCVGCSSAFEGYLWDEEKEWVV